MEKMIEVGKVLKPHGIKGEIKIQNLSFGHFDFTPESEVIIDGNAYIIESASVMRDIAILALKDKQAERPVGLEGARTLAGKSVLVPRGKLVLKNEFLCVELIGKSIVSEGVVLGKINDIENYGSADVVFCKGKKNFSFANTGGIIERVSDEDDAVFVNERKLREVICYED